MPLTHIGRYEITETLGLGAMGIVYKAYDPLIERTVAIKTVGWTGLTREESDEFERRFFREAKSAGRLNHPNIVTIHDIGRSEDLAFITMEFLSGRSLRDILDSGVAQPLWRIAEIVAAIADGLAFAHANDVVHRDIEPANIMVLGDGTVKITDFSIALLPGGSATPVGTAFGSPKYMSPEQMAGKKADGRSDVFSLGVVLYEMLTGQPPFTGDNAIAILNQVLNGAPPLPSSHAHDLPASFDRIVARALAKYPEERYQNAAEMAVDLRNYRNIPGLMHQEQAADDMPLKVAMPLDAWHDGDATVQISTVTPPKKVSLALRFGTALVALAPLTGVLLLYPAPLPPAEAESLSATSAPLGTTVSEVQDTRMPAAADVQSKPLDSRAAPAAPAVVERKTEETMVTKQASAKNPAAQASGQKAVADSSGASKTALRADLLACDRQSFVPRIYCVEKARWKYCSGRWGSVEECVYGNKERG